MVNKMNVISPSFLAGVVFVLCQLSCSCFSQTIKLPVRINYPANEYSGICSWGDKIILMPTNRTSVENDYYVYGIDTLTIGMA